MSFLINPFWLGASGPTFIGSTTYGEANVASYSVDLTGIAIAQNDIVIVATGQATNGGPLSGVSCSGNNSGAYTLDGSASEGSDSWDTGIRIYYKVQGATPDTSLTIGRAAVNTGGCTAVHVWRNIDTATPIDTTGTSATGTNTGRGDPAAITPTNAGAIILACGVGAQPVGGSAFTVPSGMDNAASGFQDPGSNFAVGIFIASTVWSSGSYDPAAWTGGTNSTSASWSALTAALKPA